MKAVHVLFALGGLALFAPGCPGTYPETCVKVRRCDDRSPITGARVRISALHFEGFTDSKGEACTEGFLSKSSLIRVDKPTYESKEITTDAGYDDICLEPERPDRPCIPGAGGAGGTSDGGATNGGCAG